MIFLLLLTVLIVLSVSFLCSLMEAVLLSLNPLSLRLQEKKGSSVSGRWLKLKNQIERPVSAILVFNTLANTGLATLAGAISAAVFGSEWLWLFSVIISVLVLFGGEMAPKIIGVHHAEKLAPRLIGPLTWMLRLCHPLVLLMEKFCERLKSTSDTRTQSDHIMDIITLVQAAKAEQLIHNREEIIIIHAATLSARRVRTAMVPHEAVKVFDTRLSLLENVRNAGEKLHRSYPVSRDGTLNQLTGYIRVRELFVQNLTTPGSDWRTLIRPVLHIDEKASLTQLLTLFLEKQEIAALVDDPQNQITGWITMDDVMKVLMGARI
jgi:CBS domain containing-hemolysin-like protein